MLVHAWEQVTALTIANCYRHCGFSTEALQADEPPVLEHGVTAPMADVLEDVCFADYVDVDSSAVVCGALTDDDIICQVRSAEPVAASDDDEEEDEAPVRPSAAEVMAGLNAARRTQEELHMAHYSHINVAAFDTAVDRVLRPPQQGHLGNGRVQNIT
ncbi:hypothetical protein HPB50_021933 [Hyalomma asiaticum]|uniref:Uncharacterized protein n=1 Tax=Hyalomma asiaticum TaxID=266040 RepID=A0ACB7SH63_HYAAI|nr:hypothetical protein HPB50_021933 [Hyalomma asiaticum]